MSLMTRVFGSKKPVSPADHRIEHAVAPEQDTPRPLRGASYREASVTYESGYTRKGIVLDYTPNGVRIRFPTNEIMPDFVTVNARAVNVSGQARVIWQEGSEVGLALVR
ncbi:hypothetical protein [Hyphomonas sp.]|jgi:hypothetical protein|uniref:hypothetical protein n=1 Tax=Hyphomonas sp. TaxID=87 RepID=UPI0039E54C31